MNRKPLRWRTSVVVLLSGLVLLTVSLPAQPRTKIKAETVQAFDAYVEAVEATLRLGSSGSASNQWLREDKPAEGGKVTVEKWKAPSIPSGIIHDWRGAVLVHGVSPAKVAGLLTDYQRHSRIYPEVIESRVLEEHGQELRSYLKLRKKQVLTVVLDTEYQVQKREVSPEQWIVESRSTRIQEVKDPGKPGEKKLPAGEDSGFLWRLNTYWNLKQVGNGTLIECVTISLSRSIPTGLGWIIRPFVNGMPKEALKSTLEATRQAILQQAGGPEVLPRQLQP